MKARRKFLQESISLTGLLAVEGLRGKALAVPPANSNPAFAGNGFKLGTVTYNLGKDMDLETLIKTCEETGFEAVELRTSHKHGVEPSLSPAQRQEVRRRFDGTRVRLLSLGSTCEYHSPDLGVVRKNVEETKQFVELAHDVGALGVKVRPNGLPKNIPEEKTLEQIGRSLKECGEFAQRYGIEIWVEVHGRDTSLPRRMKRIMEVASHPQVGVCWNSNDDDVESGSVRASFEMLRPWLRNVHINELWKKDYPWKELFHLLQDAGYSRYTLAEIPDNCDAIRLMRYYRSLWQQLVA
ncbi:MAG: sugar phosphate isomerase/epimerase family protein [Acidobacteriota bacterium]